MIAEDCLPKRKHNKAIIREAPEFRRAKRPVAASGLPVSGNCLARRAFFIAVAMCCFLADITSAAVGTWAPLASTAPFVSGGGMLLLSDGTVLAKSKTGGTDGIGNTFFKLTPDIHGSYINGTWTAVAPMIDTRIYYASQVLKDGRVFVAGGENGTGRTHAEIYDPVLDTWSATPPSGQNFRDANSEILPDGRVLVAPVFPSVSNRTIIFNPTTNTWTPGPITHGNQDETSWVKLPDGSILTIDIGSTYAERYIPASNTWVADATAPVALYDPYAYEIGAGFLLPNGNVIFFGATGHTAIYTPSGTMSPGSWVAGPDIPNSQGPPDAAAAMMVNGKILCAVSHIPTAIIPFATPTSFYEYDYTTNTFTQTNAPGGALTSNNPCYDTNMLDLPDGTVLYSQTGTAQYYVYTPNGSPLTAGKPVISSISNNGDGSYHLTGTQLNGISEGAAYGDDWQMATNYPIVRLTSGGDIYYARTYNWSSTGVMTGAIPVTTEFKLPSAIPEGIYSLVVVANGISSDPVSFVAPPNGILSVSGPGGLTSSGNIGGPFTPSGITYIVSNTGTAPLNWYATKTANWLTLSPLSGALAPGTGTVVTVALNANAQSLVPGIFGDAITFTSTTNGNAHVTRPASLTVAGNVSSLAPPLNLAGFVSPPVGVFSGPGVTASGIFDPGMVGPGTYVITYTVSGVSATITIPVAAPPVIRPVAAPAPVLSFDGVNRYIVDGGPTIPLSNASFTIEFWAKRGSVGAYHVAVSQGSGTLQDTMLFIGFRDTDVFTFGFGNDDLDTAVSYTDIGWHHWACTYDATTHARKIYRDGAFVAGDTTVANFSNITSASLIIGANSGGSAEFFDGWLGGVRVWNSARNGSRVSAGMFSSPVGSETGLLAYWPLDDGRGTTVESRAVDHPNPGIIQNPGNGWQMAATSFGTLLVEINSAFAEPGATAVDGSDNPLTVGVTNDVLVNVAGSYGVIYSATDPATGITGTVRRTVHVFSAPEIVVEQPAGTGLTGGVSTVTFNVVTLGNNAVLSFTIRNSGTANLTGLSVSKDGANSADFTVGPLGLITLAPGEGTTFTVTFAPGAIGSRAAAIHIGSNDADANPFDLTLTGTGLTRREGWRLLNFGSIVNSGDGADANDYDLDGMSNFLEFCLGTDPKQAGEPVQSLIRNGANLEFSYMRAKAAVLDGIVFSVEWKDDLSFAGSWSTAGVTETILSNDGVTQQVKATMPAGTIGQRFVHLQATGQ